MVQKWYNMEMEIILILAGEEYHLRGIAKKLNKSHSTVMRKLNTLINENVLDYKMKGKNKVFFIKKNIHAKNYVFNAERYKFLKILREYPRIGVIIDDILKTTNEKMIILFGSYAKFSAKSNSDIDIYIETKNKKIKEDIESLNTKIMVKTGPFDLKSELIKEIVKNHVILRGMEEFYDKIEFFE